MVCLFRFHFVFSQVWTKSDLLLVCKINSRSSFVVHTEVVYLARALLRHSLSTLLVNVDGFKSLLSAPALAFSKSIIKKSLQAEKRIRSEIRAWGIASTGQRRMAPHRREKLFSKKQQVEI